MARLEGKVALISGAARGLGAAFARAFAQEGAKLVFGDIDDAAGRDVEGAIRAGGGAATYLHLDVTRDDDWRRAIEVATELHGRLDILVNNAGVVLPAATIEERTAEEWDRIMAVNAKGVFLGTKYAIPALRRAGGGAIVNISSLAGIGQSQIMEAAYAASKGAVRIFSKATAAQYARDGIRCNSVHPGPVDSGMLKDFYADPERLKQRLARVPLGRLASEREVVNGVLYLASDESSYTTGTELVIDGGALAQ
jgi:cyclopentanol dehydrogenase